MFQMIREVLLSLHSTQGPETLQAYTDFDVLAPSWGRSDELHYFRKSCCLSDMLNYSKEPLIIQRNRKFNVLVVSFT